MSGADTRIRTEDLLSRNPASTRWPGARGSSLRALCLGWLLVSARSPRSRSRSRGRSKGLRPVRQRWVRRSPLGASQADWPLDDTRSSNSQPCRDLHSRRTHGPCVACIRSLVASLGDRRAVAP
jgi:hypothetical protein